MSWWVRNRKQCWQENPSLYSTAIKSYAGCRILKTVMTKLILSIWMDLPYPRNSENSLILSRFPDSFLSHKIHCVMENPSYLNLKLARSKTPTIFIIQCNPSSRRKIDHQEKSTLASLVPWRPSQEVEGSRLPIGLACFEKDTFMIEDLQKIKH